MAVPLKLTRNTYIDGALVGPPLVIAVDEATARTLIAGGFAEATTDAPLRTQPSFPVAHADSPTVTPRPAGGKKVPRVPR